MMPAETKAPPALSQLRRIFEHERRGDYSDKVVIGGLDSFLQRTLAQLSSGLLPEQRELVEMFNFPSYAATPRGDRPDWLTNVDRWLNEILERGSTPAPPKSLPPRPVAIESPRPKRKEAAPSNASLDSPIVALKGFDARVTPKFARLGVMTVRDLLYFFPHRHLDRRNIRPIEELLPGPDETILATIWEVVERSIGPRRVMVEATVSDDTGSIRATWFNQPWLAKQLKAGSQILLSGRVEPFKGRLTMSVSDYEIAGTDAFTHAGRLVPVYPLTEGLVQRTVRRLLRPVVEHFAGQLADPLPAEMRREHGLMDLEWSVSQMHFPDDPESLERALARLGFDELFTVQLGMLKTKDEWQRAAAAEPIAVPPGKLDEWLGKLPFGLTGAQARAVETIFADLGRDEAMSRLLQGDVGSGKTVVAALALAAAVEAGGQGAILAPTEILANQHGITIAKLLELMRPGTKTALLTGSIKGVPRREILEGVASGEIDVLVGTHAVIQGNVEFRRLTAGVVDEQHRFGVAQRAALRQKGQDGERNPHILVMTATPIPRTLALTIYGDLDLSVLNELPPGRQPILTRLISEEKRQIAYEWVREEVLKGRQAFVICPLVEESEKIDAKAATVEFERLKSIFPDLSLGLVHGRMKPKEKDEAMLAFRDGQTQILVSTAVVEVGIDVPNASIMLIEGAERFGLSQLHQFRGRVGRGAEQSYCLLLSEVNSAESRKRLKIVESTTDGFKLAEADLELRGPGEFFGVRQSGLPELRVARLTNVGLVELARDVAGKVFETDPKLELPEHQAIRESFERFWREGAVDRS